MPHFVEGDEIVPNLWQGSYPGTGRAVAASGFSMLVLCAVELQEPAELFPGVEVVHAPNYDDYENPLTRERLTVAMEAARRVQGMVEQGKKVLVTCRAGMNRSGLVTALALHLLYNWDGGTCIRKVRQNRTEWKGFRPLSNPDFTRALRRLQPKNTSGVPKGWREGPGGVLIPG
jgi:hypothetical protein